MAATHWIPLASAKAEPFIVLGMQTPMVAQRDGDTCGEHLWTKIVGAS
jgi:hypothetical protein